MVGRELQIKKNLRNKILDLQTCRFLCKISYKNEYSNTRINYSKIRVLEKGA
jgi:hypothetical protein